MNCFKKTATDLAEDYGVPKNLVEGRLFKKGEHMIYFDLLVLTEKTNKFFKISVVFATLPPTLQPTHK